jgi:hypothetical protein
MNDSLTPPVQLYAAANDALLAADFDVDAALPNFLDMVKAQGDLLDALALAYLERVVAAMVVAGKKKA